MLSGFVAPTRGRVCLGGYDVTPLAPDVRARMEDVGSDARPGSVQEFGLLIAEETEKWAKVVKFAGLKVE